MGLQTLKDPATRIPKEKYPAIHQAVLAACDGLDGLKDGLISDPTSCHFDPQVMACKAGDGAGCLTPKQVQSVKTILGPAKTENGRSDLPKLSAGDRACLGTARSVDLIRYDTALDQFQLHGVQRSASGTGGPSMSIVIWRKPIRSFTAC